MKHSLLIYSGGMDSTTMLHEFRDEIALAVNFSYGANHNSREAECARWQCRGLGIELLEIDLGFMQRYFRSALLSGADAIPTGEYNAENMAATVVPFRNGIMLAVAAGLAESRGLDTVMIANHSGDHNIYPDCRPEFIRAMGEAIIAGSDAKVKLSAPYTAVSKTDIALRGLKLGIDYSHTYSCYKGTSVPCGECATCRERETALAEAAAILSRLGK